MRYLHTINELNSMRKRKKGKQEQSMLDRLCSTVTFNVTYKSGIFKRDKVVKLKVWFTNKQIYKMTDILTHRFFDDIPEVKFKVGDKIKVALDWASDGGYEIDSIKNRNGYDRLF